MYTAVTIKGRLKMTDYQEIINTINEKYKYSLREIAEYLGVTDVIVCLWRSGKRYPSLKNQRKIDKWYKELGE
jgi:transcriptional regulator with XRE-family HTH domain